MTARILPIASLRGYAVLLEPITGEDQLHELAPAIRRPEVWAGGYGGGPSGFPPSDEAFVQMASGWLPAFVGGRSFLVRAESDGRVVGTSSLGHVDRAREVCEIGWTAFAPEVWGTPVNPACKLLLLDHAFEQGYGKVVLNVDGINERSLAAVAKLGATKEGILRRDRPRPDGTWRDTHMHAILASEYAPIRARLLERLGG